MDFSKGDTSSVLNGLFPCSHLRGILEGKHYRTFDTVFPFVSYLIDRATGLAEQAKMTRLHTICSDQASFQRDTRALK